MKLAERETTFGKNVIKLKEVRKLSDNGHQMAIVTTARTLNRRIIYLDSMDIQKRADPHHKSHNQWVIKKSETIEAISRDKKQSNRLSLKKDCLLQVIYISCK